MSLGAGFEISEAHVILSWLSTPVDQMRALSSCCLPAAILPAMTVMNSNLS